jgi:phosphoribosylformylglycinamidine (FGAM) synthase PurS component
MKKSTTVVALLVGVISLGSPVFAIKQFNDQFKAIYAGDKANKEFVELVTEAKCNVCHVEKENKKKVRNPFGEALHEALEKDKFPVADFKKDPEKFSEQLKEIFTKVVQLESGDEKLKTFADRMEAKLLPGGDIEGKGLGKKD